MKWLYGFIKLFEPSKLRKNQVDFPIDFTPLFSLLSSMFSYLLKRSLMHMFGLSQFSHFAKSLVKVSSVLNGIDCRFNGTLRPIDTCDTCVGKFLIAIQCHLANMHTFLKLFLLKIFKVTQIFGLDIPFRAWTHRLIGWVTWLHLFRFVFPFENEFR